MAFKAGAGGLVDIEFLAQALELRFGPSDPALRVPGTRGALRALASAGRLPADAAALLLENYEFLRRVETALRLDANRAVSWFPADPAELEALARWMGFAGTGLFMEEHLRRLAQSRETFVKIRSLLDLCTLP